MVQFFILSAGRNWWSWRAWWSWWLIGGNIWLSWKIFGGEPCNSFILHGDKAQNSLSPLEGEISLLVVAFRLSYSIRPRYCAVIVMMIYAWNFGSAAEIVQSRCEGWVWNMRYKYEGERAGMRRATVEKRSEWGRCRSESMECKYEDLTPGTEFQVMGGRCELENAKAPTLGYKRFLLGGVWVCLYRY